VTYHTNLNVTFVLVRGAAPVRGPASRTEKAACVSCPGRPAACGPSSVVNVTGACLLREIRE
jgi:hypothetical protein